MVRCLLLFRLCFPHVVGLHRRMVSARKFSTEPTQKSTFSGQWKTKMKEWKFPAALGFVAIGAVQWYHLNFPSDTEKKLHPATGLSRLPGQMTPMEAQMATERQVRDWHF